MSLRRPTCIKRIPYQPLQRQVAAKAFWRPWHQCHSKKWEPQSIETTMVDIPCRATTGDIQMYSAWYVVVLLQICIEDRRSVRPCPDSCATLVAESSISPLQSQSMRGSSTWRQESLFHTPTLTSTQTGSKQPISWKSRENVGTYPFSEPSFHILSSTSQRQSMVPHYGKTPTNLRCRFHP